MKKLFALILSLLMLSALLAGCAPKAAEPAATEAPAAPAATEAPAAPAEPAATEAPAEPAATEAPTEPVVESKRIIVFESAVLDMTASDQPRGDEKFAAYSVSELVEKYGIAAQEACKAVGSDGYAADEKYSEMSGKYISLVCENAPIFVGEAQDPAWAVWNMAYIDFGSSDIVAFACADEVSIKDLFAAIGMPEVEEYKFVCTDSYEHVASAADIAESYIIKLDGRVDGKVPGIGDYTLYNLLTIEPVM